MNHFQNVLIDSNLVVRQTDPRLPFPTYLQGIDAFDADWTNVKVTNNVVVTSACHGITFGSIHNSLVANNTVVEDGLVSVPGCTAAINVGGATHEGSLSSNTAVRNNLTSQLNVDTRNSGVVPDHNVAMCCRSPEISWYVNGVRQFIGQPGTYTNGNIIDAGGTKAEFVNFNPATLTYNVLLKSGAQAIGAGTAAGAPTVDILGVKRTAPYTVQLCVPELRRILSAPGGFSPSVSEVKAFEWRDRSQRALQGGRPLAAVVQFRTRRPIAAMSRFRSRSTRLAKPSPVPISWRRSSGLSLASCPRLRRG